MLYQLFFWGVPTITLIGYMFLFLFFLVAKKDKDIRAFIPFLIALMFWTASSLLMKIQFYPGVDFWNKAMIAGMFIAPLLFYYFLSAFTNNIKWIPLSIWSILTAASIYFDITGQVVTDSKMVYVTVTENGITTQRPEFVYTLGSASVFVYVLLFIFILSFLYKSISAAKKGYINFSSIRPIIIGNFVIFFGILSNILPEFGKYPIDLLSGFIYVILILVSIYKHRFLEFRFMLTKGALFAVCVIAMTGTYLYATYNLQIFFVSNYGDNAPMLTAGASLILAIVYQQVLSAVSRFVEKINYKSEYVQRHALKNFSVHMLNNLNLNEITAELLDAVEKAIHTTHASMMIWNEEKQCFTILKTTAQLHNWDITFTVDHPVVKWFNSNNNECLTKDMMATLPFFKSMWDSEKRAINDMKIEVIVPIKSRTGLAGIMLLSEKDNSDPYTLNDLDILASLGATSGVAIDNAVLFNRAQTQAMTDPLTKLYNHRYFYSELQKQISIVKDSPLSVIMVDVDLFKLYNDLHGHLEGDKALTKVAKIMLQSVGDRGTVCRYGGDEFAIILPFHDSRKANDIAERIRTLVQKTFLDSNDTVQRFLTTSSGLCTYPYSASSIDKLISYADMALYQAKNNGKNQTVIYTSELYSQKSSENQEETSAQNNPFYTASIYALTAAIDFKDHYTFGHSQNVSEVSTLIASELGLDKVQIEIIKEAALLHDVGKIGIPENILTKQSCLTQEEYEIVKKHVEISIEIAKHLPLSNQVVPVIIGHHERWDGKGYPRGISGEHIDIGARCLSVADAFDSMISGRPYKKAIPIEEVLSEIESKMGTQFDPKVARTLISLVKDGKVSVYNKYTKPKVS